MTYRFICSHCGKSFELDTPVAKECPFCYWSSTVKPEDKNVTGRKKDHGASAPSRPSRDSRSRQELFSWDMKYLAKVLLGVAGVAAVAGVGYWGYGRFATAPSQALKPLTIDFLKMERTPANSAPAASGIAALSPEEKEALYREAVLPANRVPDASEQEILNRTVRIETGWVEKLPSAIWTPEQYTRMIDGQERFYKMPFARSYKNKLLELFKTQYLAGADAFAKGDLLAARDFWVGSLAFPLYSKDLRKHRAVALTMLRPFINDTLAKIRALNQSVVDKGKRLQEEALSVEYQKLTGLIARKQWTEARAAIASLASQVMQLQQSMKLPGAPPQYPPSFGAIDVDLQRPLMGLMATNPSSLADLQPLQQDLIEKKDVLESFTEEYMKNAMATYRNAMTLIHARKWEDAVRTFEALSGPQSLQEDAARKISILKKISQS